MSKNKNLNTTLRKPRKRRKRRGTEEATKGRNCCRKKKRERPRGQGSVPGQTHHHLLHTTARPCPAPSGQAAAEPVTACQGPVLRLAPSQTALVAKRL